MRTIHHQHRFKNTPIILVVFLALLFVGCSGYQSVSYYQDGIYGDAGFQQVPQQAVNTAPLPQQSGTYYKNYFAEKAAQGIQDDVYFTSPEEYQNPTPEQTSAGNYQAHGSWGDQTDRININVVYNRPFGWNMGWGWYDAPYTFGRSSFWGFNYHPWYFTYGFNHHPYYNPYRFGWGRGNYWNNWGYQDPYWDRRYYNRNVYRDAPIYTRLNGSRTITRTSTQNRSGRNVNSNSINTNNRTNARGTTRTNTSAQRSANTTQGRQATSTRNRTPSRTTTRRSNSSTNNATTSQPRNNSSRVYSNNNSSYRSSSSSSSNSYRSASPSRTTNTTRSSSPSRSTNSTRRR